jgi:hypothetical protein
MIKRGFITSILVVVVVFSSTVVFATSGRFDFSLRRGETRKTVSPERYLDPVVRKAYMVAREIPWVLDSIYCYCFCEESPAFRHKSLLSCYTDDHAAQ